MSTPNKQTNNGGDEVVVSYPPGQDVLFVRLPFAIDDKPHVNQVRETFAFALLYLRNNPATVIKLAGDSCQLDLLYPVAAKEWLSPHMVLGTATYRISSTQIVVMKQKTPHGPLSIEATH